MSTRAVIVTLVVLGAAFFWFRHPTGGSDDGFFAPYSDAAVLAATESKRPVIIETYADW